MKYLDSISKPTDVRKLSFEELDVLASEIRQFLIDNVSKTGGHLASNLGAVELTIAIHNVFDTEKDRLVFDVGHQSYVHKILTGRKDGFSTLRQMGGISGFPKPNESIHDAFTAGHASTSVSTALGMARARTLTGKDYHVIAVIGDGAATGGTFYEAMNDAGDSGEPLIVILNDNEMSIAPNVGGLSNYLSALRLKPGYIDIKKAYRKAMKTIPGGKTIYWVTHKIKEWIRRSLLGTTIFEDMGFRYLGPVDGHNIKQLSYLLEEAKKETTPVLLHVLTKKGKGYLPAEEAPANYHGVGKFSPEFGVQPSVKRSFSDMFGSALCKAGETNKRLCAITAGMRQGTGLTEFSRLYPERFYDVGIAEEHAVSMAAGLAKQGMLPVVAIYSTFLQRAYDMIMQDVALQQLPVIFCIDRSGLVGEDGETHHGVFDVGFMSQVPGMRVYSPASFAELENLLETVTREANGPVAIRYPRGGEGSYTGTTESELLQEGSAVTVLTYGITINTVLEANGILKEQGIKPEIIKLLQLSPNHFEQVIKSVQKTGKLVIVEEQNQAGCIARAFSTAAVEADLKMKAKFLNLGNRFSPQGTNEQLRNISGIGVQNVVDAVLEVAHE